MRVVHCDLKPDNILVSPDGHLTISDFGLSISWLDPRYHHYPSHAFRCRRLAGTDGYMAPEIVSAVLDPNMPRRGNFGFAADIWSLGLIFAELGMGGRRFVSLDDEGEGPRWEGDFKRFARTMMLSPEMLAKRIEENLRDDHARLVERVRVISRLTPSRSDTDSNSSTKMLQIGEAYRANFDEIASHPFFSQLDMAKVIDKGYTGTTIPLIYRHRTPTDATIQFRSLRWKKSCPADTQTWMRSGSRNTRTRMGGASLYLKVWETTQSGLCVSHKILTGTLFRRTSFGTSKEK